MIEHLRIRLLPQMMLMSTLSKYKTNSASEGIILNAKRFSLKGNQRHYLFKVRTLLKLMQVTAASIVLQSSESIEVILTYRATL